MKKIILKSITLTNFRGEKSRTTRFNDGETSITGGNGLGKSRHFDAFVWLLFGKDTEGRENFNVRTVVDGEPLHRVECSVEAELNISGETVTLKRSFDEKWVKPRGQVDEVFKGDETGTYWNGVPVNVSEYSRRVAEIVDGSVFKMITNPVFFTGMDWKLQREQLFRIAGAVSDSEIAAGNPEFTALLDRISGKPFDDFKAELAARKKRLKADLAQIQPRIDQTSKLTPETADWSAMEAEIADIDKQIASTDKAITDKNEAVRQQNETFLQKQSEINALRQKQQKLLNGAKAEAAQKAFEAGEERRNTENSIKAAEAKLETLNRILGRYSESAELSEAIVVQRTKELEALRKEWQKVNAEEYVGSGETCPCCKQPLPEDMKAGRKKLFDRSKTETLEEITGKAQKLKEKILSEEEAAAKILKETEATRRDIEGEERRLADLRDKLATMPEVNESATFTPPQECIDISTEIVEQEKALHDVEPADTKALQAQKKTLSDKRDGLLSALKNRGLISKYAAEIAELEKEGKKIAQQIADAEREEFIMQQFSKARIEECTSRINGLFRHVTFRLFKYTVDGNESETCEALVNGVPFKVANTAAQINAGLDIINTLTRFYGVSAPIFIDRRESVNELTPTESQIINLIVSNDKELIIK
jgi:DNA repair exonuclease SbcCD ATPase subunit